MTRKPKDFKEEEVFEMLIKKGGGQNQWELRSTIQFNMDVVEQRFPAEMTFILNKFRKIEYKPDNRRVIELNF